MKSEWRVSQEQNKNTDSTLKLEDIDTKILNEIGENNNDKRKKKTMFKTGMSIFKTIYQEKHNEVMKLNWHTKTIDEI